LPDVFDFARRWMNSTSRANWVAAVPEKRQTVEKAL
jgi:hypothetical protein